MFENIKQARKASGLTVQGASILAGVHVSYWYLIEQGKRIPSLDVAFKMAHILGKTVDELFGEHIDIFVDVPRNLQNVMFTEDGKRQMGGLNNEAF